MSVNYPGDPDPRLWVSRRQHAADLAALGSRVSSLGKGLNGVLGNFRPLFFGKEVTVTYLPNGGDGDSYTGGSSLYDPYVNSCDFTPPPGKSFAGWCADPGGNGPLLPAGDVGFLEFMSAADLFATSSDEIAATLYAIWR